MAKQQAVPPTFATAESWSESGAHTAQLPSGAWVRFRFPDLGALAGAGKVPDILRGIALARIAREVKLLIEPGDLPDVEEATVDEKTLTENTQLNYWLISQMLVEPKITPAQVPDLPSEDVDMLLELGERNRDTDARGVVMGVTPLSRFARFRLAHGCGEDCEGCERLRSEGSHPLDAVAL